jgi:hypothetical protein
MKRGVFLIVTGVLVPAALAEPALAAYGIYGFSNRS